MKSQKTALSRRLQWRLSCNHVIATAKCIQDQLVNLGLKSPERVSVVGEWADEDFFDDHDREVAHDALCAELQVAPSTCLFAVIGMLRKDKGQEYFVAAAERFLQQQPSARFLIIGAATATEQEYEALLRQRVEQAGLQDQVVFMGYRDDVPRLLRALDAVVLASVDVEAQSRIVPQAFAARVPVVASDVGGVAELVVEGRTGFLVRPRDTEAIADRLLQLVRDAGLRRSLIAAAHDYAQQQLRIEQKMEQTLAVYRRVIARRKRS